jgi:hypothetical protein
MRGEKMAGRGKKKDRRARPDREPKGKSTYEFPIDAEGHVLSITYRTAPQFSTRTRQVYFRCNFPDASEQERRVVQRMFKTAEALREGKPIDRETKIWLANALERIAYQTDVEADPLDPEPVEADWNAREAFGLPKSDRGRPLNPPWRDLYFALDVAFQWSLGITQDEAVHKAAKAWKHGPETVRKAWKDWGRKAKSMVKQRIDDDSAHGIPDVQSVADHVEGLRIWRAQVPSTHWGIRPRYLGEK